jgi:hypothetical protein
MGQLVLALAQSSTQEFCMDGKTTVNGAADQQPVAAPQARRKRNGSDPNVHVRYFLP